MGRPKPTRRHHGRVDKRQRESVGGVGPRKDKGLMSSQLEMNYTTPSLETVLG